MDVVKKANIKFPFLYEIVQLNHDYLLELKVDEDFDSYIILMNLYLYTCKNMKRNNMELNKDNIYKNMEIMFNNIEVRNKLIQFFTIDTQLKLE